jgi:serpin B
MSTAAAGDTLDEILRVAGAPSREKLATFVRGTVVDGVLADQSGIGGPSISFACGSWTDVAAPARVRRRRRRDVQLFKGNSWAVDFKNEVTIEIVPMHFVRSISLPIQLLRQTFFF